MKILHVLATNRFSGAENVVCQIADMMSVYNYRSVYTSPNGEIEAILRDKGITYAPMKTLSVNELRRVIREEAPDIIHAHDMRASFVASLSTIKVPIVAHIHNNAFDSRGISIKSVLFLFAAKRAKKIIWVSKSAFSGYRFQNLIKRKSKVMYNVINTDKLYEKVLLDAQQYQYDIVFLGRMSYAKDPHKLLDVCALVKEKKGNVKIGVIGTGEMYDEIVDYAEKLGLMENVDFLGFMRNPYKILHDSKVMVMTSRWEGLPMCALEAMALGVPIVTTPTDGLCDLVVHDETGFLSEDDEELSNYIFSIIKDAELRKNLSRNTLKRYQKVNSISSYREEIQRIYTNIK